MLKIELKRIFHRYHTALILLFFIAIISSVSVGINGYKNEVRRLGNFKEIEKKRLLFVSTWDQYGAMGVRLIFAPSKLYVLSWGTGGEPGTTANLSTMGVLDISKSNKSGHIRMLWLFDNVHLLYWLGTILTLYFLTRLPLLSRLISRKVLVRMAMWRIIILSIIYLLSQILAVLIMFLSGIHLDKNELMVFGGWFVNFILFQVLLYYFCIWAVMVSKRRLIAVSIGGALALVIMPMIALLSTSIPDLAEKCEALNLQKIKRLTTFEADCRLKYTRPEFLKLSLEEKKQILMEYARTYIEDDMRLGEKLELELLYSASTAYRRGREISSLIPGAGNFLACSEMAHGISQHQGFWSYSIPKHVDFVEYIIKNKYSKGAKRPLVSYIKADENCYYPRPSPPATENYLITLALVGYFIYLFSRRLRSIYAENTKTGKGFRLRFIYNPNGINMNESILKLDESRIEYLNDVDMKTWFDAWGKTLNMPGETMWEIFRHHVMNLSKADNIESLDEEQFRLLIMGVSAILKKPLILHNFLAPFSHMAQHKAICFLRELDADVVYISDRMFCNTTLTSLINEANEIDLTEDVGRLRL